MQNSVFETIKEEVIDNKCPNCGSDLKFEAGTNMLSCESCGSSFDIQSLGRGKLDSEENSYLQAIEQLAKEKIKHEIQRVIQCSDCGGLITLNKKTISTSCPFCGSFKTVVEEKEEEVITIDGVIPFKIKENEVKDIFKKWIKKRFLAPRKLKKGRLEPSYSAFYIPFWTFDSDTYSSYTARRGDYYYTTRTVRTKNGTRVERVRHIRWRYVSGNISHFFDDIIIRGTSNSLNKEIDKIKSFNFNEMEKYQEKYLLGYYAEKPSISLPAGFGMAKQEMTNKIKNMARQQIGGDVVDSLNVSTNFTKVTFKQIMAPIYNGHYTYNKKNYHFVVNAQTGKFVGKSPISPLKVSILVILALILIVALCYFMFIYGEVSI